MRHVVTPRSPPQHHEVDILGLDGHIYKGRMDTRLPGIPNKDSECPGGPAARRPRLSPQMAPLLEGQALEAWPLAASSTSVSKHSVPQSPGPCVQEQTAVQPQL